MTNLAERRPSCFIDPCIQPHDSLHRPHALGGDVWYCLWCVMEIEEKELDREK